MFTIPTDLGILLHLHFDVNAHIQFIHQILQHHCTAAAAASSSFLFV